ncbi:hypothetical protein [Mycobacterium noviomagense]|uniref:Uncharacterized protein n=1 Tax=Mycobacterium noviomagense TaxID=459858 RepID=A0A7I7PDT6_9MYCO|nr:hypothetical protein [Mycobacterium noviomagense]BBY06740.1 hypothetical protein MNVI_20580 [Mycobacterium noviomagense]
MSNGDDLLFELEKWLAAHGLNVPPPPITSDPVAPVRSSFDALLAAVGLAANGGDPADNAAAQDGHAEREAKIAEATTKFPANEEQSASKLAGVGDPNQMLQMVQQMPQMATGAAQSAAGALGGLMNPLMQVPQQIAQVGQQAMQAGMGALQHGAGSGAAAAEALPGELLGAGGGLGGGAAELAGAAGGAGGALGGTTPTAMLGPPPAPSAGTVPMSSPTPPPVPPSPSEQTGGPRGGMSGMPMVPPGAMHGGGATGNDAKADTKRVVPPSVKNGAPVQGRMVTPPSAPEVTKRVHGKPVAARRILAPDVKPEEDADQTR